MVRRSDRNSSNIASSYALSPNMGTYSDNKYTFGSTNAAAYITSTDGIQWEFGSLGYNQFEGARWSDCTWTGLNFVSVAGANFSWDVCAYSADGIIWNTSRLPQIAAWTGVWSNGTATLAYGGGYYSYSNDHGVTWSKIFTIPYAFSKIIEGNGLFVGLVSSSSTCYTSTDGITWTARTLPASVAWNEGIWTGTNFIALSATSTTAAYSPNGITWYSSTLPTIPVSFYKRNVVYGNGRVIVAPSKASSSLLLYSDDHGVTWSSMQTKPITPYEITSIIYLNNYFIMATSYWSSSATTDATFHSNDNGQTWVAGGIKGNAGGAVIISSNGQVAISATTGYPTSYYVNYGVPGWILQESIGYSIKQIGSNKYYAGTNGFIGKI